MGGLPEGRQMKRKRRGRPHMPGSRRLCGQVADKGFGAFVNGSI